MYFSRTVLSIAAASVCFFAKLAEAQDVSVVGEHVTPVGPLVPDISVVGSHLTTGTAGAAPDMTGAPDISVAGTWSVADSSDSPATRTECYQSGSTALATSYPSIDNGLSPSGYNCYVVYQTGGGTLWSPLPHASSSPSANKTITIVLPVVVSVLGFAAIVGAVLLFMRLRARKAARANREWVNRPGGWASDSAQAESGAPKY
ncbi:hypothetical protein CPB86DRAFT_786923 [Serendipita vermifera]|nr:hypothetical protein CPB86DRAFT_786923 [Serendipita vermifera]